MNKIILVFIIILLSLHNSSLLAQDIENNKIDLLRGEDILLNTDIINPVFLPDSLKFSIDFIFYAQSLVV